MPTNGPSSVVTDVDSPSRRRIVRQVAALPLWLTLAPISSIACAGQSKIPVIRFVCEQDFKSDDAFGSVETHQAKIVSLVGEKTDDLEAALASLANTSDRYVGNFELASRWARQASDNGLENLPYGMIGLIMLRDCSSGSLQALMGEVNWYRERGVEIFVACADTPNAVTLIEEAMIAFAYPWRLFRMGRVVNEGIVTRLNGFIPQMVAFIETLLIPIANFRWPCLDFSDVLAVYEKRVVYVTRLRSNSREGVKKLFANEKRRYSLEDSLFLTAYLPGETFSIFHRHEIIDMHLDAGHGSSSRIVTFTNDIKRTNFDIYLSGCKAC